MLMMLQSDLRSLSVESRRKHPEVKEAAERAILQVRQVKEGEAEEGPAAASVGQFELVVRPLTMACKTRDPKLALISAGCLQKLIAQDAIPLESLSAVLETLVEQAGSGDEGVQAKILQTVLSLLASQTYPVRRDDLSRALSICLRLHDGGAASALINNTATATMRQAVSLLFERIEAEGGVADTARPGALVGESDCALSCAYLLVRDLCCLASSQATRWLQVGALDLAFALELLEALLSSHAAVFAKHEAMMALLREQVCQLVAELLAAQHSFDLLHRTMRLIWPIVQHFAEPLRQECGAFLQQGVSSFLPRYAGEPRAGETPRWDNEAPLWKRTLAMEMLSLILADRALCLSLLANTNMWPVLVSSLVKSIEYGLTRDKVFPSLAGSQRRVSLQLPGDTAQANSSAGYALSLGIGSMIHLAEGMDGGLAENTWQALLQMANLVMERCKAQEMVEAVLQVYVSFSATAASLRMADAQAVVISSLAKFTSAQSVPLSEKDVAVCDAMFKCVNALSQVLDAPSWLVAVSFLEQLDNILGDPKEPVGDGRIEKEHRMQLLARFSDFYACTAELGDDAFERMAVALDAVLTRRLACRDVQYRDAPLSLPRSFAIVCWPRMFGGNTYRFQTSYSPIVAHLHKAAVHQNTLVSRLGIDAMLQVITQSFQTPAEDGAGNTIQPDQTRVLQPLAALSESDSDECHTHLLDGMYTLLESCGYELSHGWSLILSIIQRGAGSDNPKVVASAFRSVQLVVTDFLSSMPVVHCQLCVVTVGRFRAQSDMNMDLTAIGQLWNIADYFGREQATLVGTLKREAASGEDNLTPYAVSEGTDLDMRAMAVATDSNAAAFASPRINDAVAPNGLALRSTQPHMDRLWRTVFAEMQLSCEDSRPEVRKCALRTLMSTLTSHGDMFSFFLWHELLWNTVFPVLASVHGAAVTADESKEGNDTVGENIGSSSGQTTAMMMHHTRNTLSKQWDETRALALHGASRVFCRFFSAFQQLDCIAQAWQLLLNFAEASLRHKSPEVVAAGVEAVTELLSECFGATASVASTPAADTRMMQALWCDAVAMLGAVSTHITADIGTAETAAPGRAVWIRMPTSPGLNEKSLLLFVKCVSTVYSKVWGTVWMTGVDVEHLAVAVDRLVHYSLRFQPPVSYVVVGGEEQSVLALSPTQDIALQWMRLVLQQQAADTTEPEPEPELTAAAATDPVKAAKQAQAARARQMASGGTNSMHSASISTLLLLHCLRYLPGGTEAVSGSGGHSLLHNSVDLSTPKFSFPLSKAALLLLLDFFALGVHSGSANHTQQQVLFVLTVKSLVRAATENLETTAAQDWSTFQTASLRGVLATVRSGIAAHTTISSDSKLDVVCEELAAVGKTYLLGAAAGPSGGAAAQEPPIGIEVAACVTETLLSAAVQTNLSKAAQRKLLEMLDAGTVLLAGQSGDDASDGGFGIAGRIPTQQQETLSAACLQSMFRVCQGDGGATAAATVTAATALPFLFARCETIIVRYVDTARCGGGATAGLPVPRWHQDELARLLDLLCGYHAATTSGSSDAASDEGSGKRVGLVARLLPAMCAASALGPGSLNRRTSSGLAHAVHLGFVSLGLQAPFLTLTGGGAV